MYSSIYILKTWTANIGRRPAMGSVDKRIVLNFMLHFEYFAAETHRRITHLNDI